MEEFKNLDSKKVFDYFYQISQIPRESNHEEQISNYLKEFAEERNLWVKQDDLYNIIIKKPGVGALQDAQPVILQTHMDMVCEKKKGIANNFEVDPIEWIIEGDYLYGKGTTLGADGGVGVAYMLTLLADNELELPPIEAVFTADEETKMTGAMGIDTSDLEGKIFINIDSEEEGKFYLSCTGGNITRIKIPINKIEMTGTLIEVEINGLIGGHSGLEIIQERANASKIMGRFLNELVENNFKFNLVEINGGTKVNAITKEAIAKIIIDGNDYYTLVKVAKTLNRNLKEEYTPQDPNARITVTKKDKGKYDAMTIIDTLRVVYTLVLLPSGPLFYNKFIDDLVQTSANIGIVETEDNIVTISSAVRSSIISQRDSLIEQYNVIGKLVGAKVVSDGFFPPWTYQGESKIKDLFLKQFRLLFNKDAQIGAVHAGLECGLFNEKMGQDVEFISFGPDILAAHTVDEHVSISSVDRSWQFLKKVLQSIKEY